MNPSVKQFRDSLHSSKVITAPSGMQYKVQRLTIMDYIKEGLTDIPNDFFRFVMEVSSGRNLGMSEEDAKKNYELFERYLTITVTRGIIDPPTIIKWEKEKEETHLLWGEVPPKDQEYIVGCIAGRIDNEKTELVPAPDSEKTGGAGAPPEQGVLGK